MSFELRCGDIYGFVTKQAANHPFRYKYHLYLCATFDTPKQHVFMFINKYPTGDTMRILPSDWGGMTRRESFILCSDLFLYPSLELKAKKLTPRGSLSPVAMERLMQHIENSKTMKEHYANIALDALTGYFAT
ncbi:MAG: hypothetical protein MJE68_13490 [Proteobacteria bacterium]|nr:hypothetical protein [Pseudomonadota bacterium]